MRASEFTESDLKSLRVDVLLGKVLSQDEVADLIDAYRELMLYCAGRDGDE